MEKNILLSNLYDIYSELLTEKQKKYFEDYYFENLTLSEMSENYNVTRNAIHNLLKDTEEKLINYEDKLKLYEKRVKIKEVIKELDVNIKKRLDDLI